MHQIVKTHGAKDVAKDKKRYEAPALLVYGSVRELTRSGTASGTEQSTGGGGCSGDSRMSCASDPRVKEAIVRIDEHPLGIGLYIFDYKPEFRDTCGHGRQFGVMADEVERVMPAAVSLHANGFKQVDYTMLGIARR